MKKAIKKLSQESLLAGIFCTVLVFAILAFVAEPQKVHGRSMIPVLLPEDRILVEKVSYKLAGPKSGDIAVFYKKDKEILIKRISQVFDGGTEITVLGDNLAQSIDSRDFGDIKSENLIGKALLIYWPPQRMRILD